MIWCCVSAKGVREMTFIEGITDMVDEMTPGAWERRNITCMITIQSTWTELHKSLSK